MSFKGVAGGLLSGLGEGMVAQDKVRREEAEARRQAALEQVKELRRQNERLQDRNWKLEDAQANREHNSGLLRRTITAEDGKVFGVTGAGDTIDLGITADTKGDGSGGGSLKSADRSLMERVSQTYWGKMNAEGQFIVPEEARDNYVQTLERAGELAQAGVDPTKATRIAAMSISGPLSEESARKQAEQEAEAEYGGWFSGSQRQEYVERRVPELMRESRAAESEYNRILGRSGGQTSSDTTQAQGGKSASKSGQGSRENPYKPMTQADFDAIPSGAIYLNPADQTLYRKN